jgi:hypothetical protein
MLDPQFHHANTHYSSIIPIKPTYYAVACIQTTPSSRSIQIGQETEDLLHIATDCATKLRHKIKIVEV